ncbi:MAG: class I SAM-dependent methyltransferase [Nitrospinota bacterium]|nr:class I SAM-dependent methyltransferase [Nitrospinota bacterium]
MTDAIGCRICGSDKTSLLYALDFSDVMRCSGCGVAFLHPLPPWEVTKDIYDQGDRYFTGNPVYFGLEGEGRSQDDPAIADYHRALEDLTLAAPGRDLLDVGCAAGTFLDIAQRKGWKTRGVELSEWASRRARQEHNLDVVTGTLEQAAFPEASFDVVTMWDVLEHVPDPVQLLVEAKRILRPGGVLYVNTISYHSLLNLMAHVAHRASLGLVTWPLRRLFGLHHIYYFSRESLLYTIGSAGFSDVRVELGEYHPERVDNISVLMRLIFKVVYKLQEGTDYSTVVAAHAKAPEP